MRPLSILALILVLSACGSQRDTFNGPGHTHLGQSVAEAEASCGWKADVVTSLPDGREARQYTDTTPSLWRGFLNPAPRPVLFFRNGHLESWQE